MPGDQPTLAAIAWSAVIAAHIIQQTSYCMRASQMYCPMSSRSEYMKETIIELYNSSRYKMMEVFKPQGRYAPGI
eukprot:gene22274-8812_t